MKAELKSSGRRLSKRIAALSRRGMALLLCAVMLAGMANFVMPSAKAAGNGVGTANGPTAGVTRQADPSTMDTYKKMLDFSENTRVAGRLWSDKTVFAYGSDEASANWENNTLTLNKADDGVYKTISVTDDFLHVYSVLGSSLQITDNYYAPIDLAIIIDMSGSMAQKEAGGDRKTDSRIGKTVGAVNSAISELMSMNPDSRVTVVAYGGSAYTLLTLDNYDYNPKIENKYIDVKDFSGYGSTDITDTGAGAYTLYTTATKGGVSINRSVRNNYTSNAGVGKNPAKNTVDAWIGYHTDMTAGIYLGFEELYKNDKVTVTYTSEVTGETKTMPRLPVAFVMTDGGTNVALKDPNTNYDVVSGTEWYDMSWLETNPPECDTYTKGEIYSSGSQNNPKESGYNPDYAQNPNWLLFQNETSNDADGKGQKHVQSSDKASDGVDGGPGVLFHTILSAAFMTAKVQNHYRQLWEKDGVDNWAALDFVVDTIGVDLKNVTGKWEQPRMYASMDPETYFNANPGQCPNTNTNADKGWFEPQIKAAYDYFRQWCNSDDGVEVQVGEQTGGGSECDIISLKKLPENGFGGVTNADVIRYINYADNFQNVDSTTMSETFQELIKSVQTPMFVPVGGMNDLGVGDAVTYVDPVGKYMDVKDVKGVSLFGTYYDITKTAVYDYQWNDKYIEASTELEKGEDALPEGWYKGEPTTVAQYHKPTETDPYPEGCANADAAWEKGWIYRLNYKTASQFVPTLSTINDDGETPDATVLKQRNTIYTFYRIQKENEERIKLHMNPAYGTDDDIRNDVTYDDSGNSDHLKKQNGVYALADMRIWVEDSGNYTDPDTGSTLTDTGYDEALWVNIPVNMLPLRKVSFDARTNPDIIQYETNLPTGTDGAPEADSAELASFPLRVFYTVGMDKDNLDADKLINVAGTISAEYINQNKVTTEAASDARNIAKGNLEFFSNWYNPLNRYSDYAITNTDYTFGDPVTSFSPSGENRYYTFEKALPLYENAYRYDGTTWEKVTIDDENALQFEGGTLIAQNLDCDQDGIDEQLKDVKPQKNDFVFLKQDLITDAEADKPTNENYYFLAIEFFNLNEDEDKTASKVQYVIARRGSELGIEDNMIGWSDAQGENKTVHDLADKPSNGDWVLSVKPGGLRVGTLAQAVQSKGTTYSTPEEMAQIDQYVSERFGSDAGASSLTWGYYDKNVTRTANNYYLPTIRTVVETTETGGETAAIAAESPGVETNKVVKVNVYLGNNGRLYVPDTTLLVTKFVAVEEGDVDQNQQFQFQVYIKDFVGEKDAVVVQWNENTQAWQRQFHYVDLELDSQRFLLTSDGQKAMVDEKGQRVVQNGDGYTYLDGTPYTQTVYYVYIDENYKSDEIGVSDLAFRVYHNDAVDTSDAVNESDVEYVHNGDESTTINTKKAHLVSQSEYTSNWEGKEAPNVTDSNSKKLDNFELLTINPNVSDENTDISISTPYRTSSSYWTIKVHFGNINNINVGDSLQSGIGEPLTKDDLFYQTDATDEVAKNTAQFTLKHGQALLFSGMPSGTVYRVTEKLTDGQIKDGYALKELVQKQQTVETTVNEHSPDYSGVYSATGDTGDREESVNYINTIPRDKTEIEINGETVEPSATNPNMYPGVQEGDTITYQIDWANDTDNEARVVIIDYLDKGVKYVGTDDEKWKVFDDVTAAQEELEKIYESTEYSAPVLDKDVNGGQIAIWDLGDRESRDKGSVTLTVKVTDQASKWWDYDGDGVADAPAEGENPDDYLVRNRATVRVAENSYTTNTVVNPVGTPDKEETQIKRSTPGDLEYVETSPRKDEDGNPVSPKTEDGPLVYVGDKIIYQISWRNYKDEPATITIRDPLDPNVKFIRAGTDSGVILEAEATEGDEKPASKDTVDAGNTVTVDGEKLPVISYKNDPETGKCEVIWNLGEKEAGGCGTVTLVVEVLSSATPVGHVDNTAYVKVGNDSEMKTKTVVNPTPEQHKKERIPGDGERVKVGEEIEYTIDWNTNVSKAPETKVKTVTITDPLDPGVEFVSASYDGVTLDSKGEKTGTSTDGLDVTIAYSNDTHTVTWTIAGAIDDTYIPETGTVTLIVKVTKAALVNEHEFNSDVENKELPETKEKESDWTYRDGTGIEEEGDQLVQNRAAVKYNNDAYLSTELVKNPLGPEKEETNPGDGAQVEIGKEIEYTIHWQNYEDVAAKVVIEDRLDDGVDIVRAMYGDVKLEISELGENAHTSETVEIPGDNGEYQTSPVIQYFNGNDHKVVWNLGVVDSLAEGDVTLVVRVNSKAEQYWQYGDEDVPETGRDNDNEVVNRASVQVGNNPKIYTQIVENPVPDKTETHAGEEDVTFGENLNPSTDPGKENVEEGTLVKVGDQITYKISFKNGYDEPAKVVVTDQLDTGEEIPGVKFVSASYDDEESGSVVLNAENTDNSVNVDGVTISYDEKTHTVTWTIEDFPANQDGYVELVVEVTSDALADKDDHVVRNQANVKVNDNSAWTVTIENPVPKLEKTETNPGTGVPVMVGQTVDYQISWNNYQTDPAKVVVRDALDPGVDFKSASFEGVNLTWDQTESGNEPVAGPSDGPNAPKKPDHALTESGKATINGTQVDVTITYNPETHEITWTIGTDGNGVPAGYDGVVKFSVVVNDEAKTTHNYTDGKFNETEEAGSEENDNQILNQGGVTVGNNDEQLTEIIPNPLNPEKDETEINDKPVKTEKVKIEVAEGSNIDYKKVGPGVVIGDVITYTISWVNNQAGEATVTVIDTFKTVGLEFVDAGFVTFENGEEIYAEKSEDGTWVSGIDDDGNTTITWTISKQESGKGGKVWVKARVTAEAVDWVVNGAEVTINDESQVLADVENPLKKVGDLTVTKTVSGNAADSDKEWHFVVELTGTSTADNIKGEDITGSFGEMTFTNGKAEFTLKSGESKTAVGLPAGLGYTVTEEEANKDGYTTRSTGAEGTITEQGASAEFVNSKNTTTLPETGGLTVTKTVEGDGDRTKEWHFTVTLSDTSVNGTYGDMEFNDGVATFTLKHGQSKTARRLPAGVTYTVTEQEADSDGYSTSSTGATGTIPTGGTARAEFINTPTGEQHKKETDPGDGEFVVVGQEITYEIDWENSIGEEADITITDPLDNGVDFVSASDGGTYDAAAHTVTWKFEKQAAGASGTVTLVVKVNSKATPVGYVENQATVQVDNKSFQTEKPWNPTDKPHKTETTPGDGKPVKVGDSITYEITWKNYQDKAADITITDPLDNGVDFVSASDGGTYDAAAHTVTWKFEKQAAGASGTVTLVVKVNSKATPVGKVENEATVQVDNRSFQTEKPENPTGGPHKTEVTPGDGKYVSVGDSITYEITWQNYESQTADVTIRDPLDVGVDFVSADNGGSYDAATHTVTWTLADRTAGAEGAVRLTVKVNSKALEDDRKVVNQAFVKVGSNPEQETEIPENPTGEKGNLTVSKTVTGSAADKNKEFTFTVTLSDTTVNGTYGGMSFTDGVAQFRLKDGESKTATGLPVGISYTVTEAEADTEGYKTTSEGANGTIPSNGTAAARFINHKDNPPDEPDKGNLTVTKTVSGNAVSTQTEFHFTVTLSDTAVNGWFGDMNFVNGVATFTLKHNESKTATGLPAGVTYTVTEEEYNHDGYTSTSTGSTGVIPGSGTASAAFQNSRSVTTQGTPGRLVVRKLVTGEGDKDKEFTFRVTLSYTGANGTYGDMVFVNGVAEFTAKSGENVIGRYIPAGVTYKVEELEADQDGYETIASGEIGTIETDVISEVRFENHIGPWEPDEPWEEFWDPDIPLVDFPPDTPPTNTPIIPETDYPPYIPPVNIPEYTPPTEISTVPGTPTTPTVPVDDVPDTGDNSNIGLWIVLAAVAALGVAVLIPKKKKGGRD